MYYDGSSLDKFVKAQDSAYSTALREIEAAASAATGYGTFSPRCRDWA